jgi:hypothetical protein
MALLLPAVYDITLGGLGQPGPDADRPRAHLGDGLRMGQQVVEPGRVLRRSCLDGEDRERVSYPLVSERGDPLRPAARPGMVQQQDVGPVKRTADRASVGPEFSDDLAVKSSTSGARNSVMTFSLGMET